jgi:pimeloyl-ACP methyl ester carboxylesterase
MKVEIEPITGRYMRLDFEGRPHRIYWEEAGQGIPLLCLHTAGSDGRQYRGLLNDPEITQHFRVIVFDMPWHGKSSPPPGFETEEYKLTTKTYRDMVLTVSRALQLEKPVVMGCSIGGRIALVLAMEHPSAFRAIIGLQAGAVRQQLGDGDVAGRGLCLKDAFDCALDPDIARRGLGGDMRAHRADFDVTRRRAHLAVMGQVCDPDVTGGGVGVDSAGAVLDVHVARPRRRPNTL